jgi:hypothetical protein
VRVPSAGPLSEWTPNDGRISSALHEQSSTLPRPPFSRPTRRNAGRLRKLDLFRAPFKGAKATECAQNTDVIIMLDLSVH